jgi:hypothetical protein
VNIRCADAETNVIVRRPPYAASAVLSVGLCASVACVAVFVVSMTPPALSRDGAEATFVPFIVHGAVGSS